MMRMVPMLLLLGFTLMTFVGAADEVGDRTTLQYGEDPNIKVVMKGRAGNLELQASDTAGEGEVVTDYQEGRGFVSFDRERQELTWESKINYTLNRFSKHIQRVAPHMRAHLPRYAELDFELDITNLGYGSLNFRDLNLSSFELDSNYGDVDVSFPTVNKSILRGTASFHLMTGDMEISDLANLKAAKVRINGGVGELSVDLGPRLHQDMEVKLDHDIGAMDLTIPRGTHVVISGTSRDLDAFGFQKQGQVWETVSYHENSPTLSIRLTGPLGDLRIIWD